MKSLSRVSLAVELLLLALPITVLYGIVFAASLVRFPSLVQHSSNWLEISAFMAMLLGGLLIAFSLYSFWCLVYVFYADGVAALKQASAVWWWMISLATVYSLLGLLVYLAEQFLRIAHIDLYSLFYPGIAGLPVAVPALHLYWIRIWQPAENPE